MREFAILFKTLYKNANTRQVKADGSRRLSRNVLTLIVMIPIAAVFCFTFGMLTVVQVKDIESLSVVIAGIVGIGQIAALIFGLYGVINTLYSGSDRALLNSLPIRPATVFMAKFALAYLEILKISSLIIIPLSLTSAIAYAACGREMFYAFFVLIFLVALIAPLLPLALITLFSLPISYIGSFLKGHTALKSALYCAIYALVFAGYIALIVVMNASPSGEEEEAVGLLAGFATFGNVMYPSKVAVLCALGIDGGVNFGITLGITVGLIGLTVCLAALFFKRISRRSLESNDGKARKNASFKQNRLVLSLMKKDFLSIVRDPKIAMSSFGNMIVSPLFTVLMYFMTTAQMNGADAPEARASALVTMLSLSTALMFSSLYLGVANTLAILAFTREGKAYYVNKSFPIPAKAQITAKLLLAIAAGAIINVVNFVVLLALFGEHILNALAFYICATMCVVGGSSLNIYADVRYGNANWTTRQDLQQVSGGLNRFCVALLCCIAPIIILIAGVAIGVAFPMIGASQIVAYAAFWSVAVLVSAAYMTAGLVVVLKHAAKYVENFGERAFISRKRMRSPTLLPPR